MTTPNQPPWGGRQPWPPQQPYGQPGYGHWQQPPPPPPPPKSKKFLYWLVPLVVVVVAAAVVVPIVLTSGGSDKPPAAAASSPSAAAPARTSWQYGPDKIQRYDNGITTWLVDDAVVVVRDGYVASFARADGTQRWLTPAPKGNFCGTGIEPVNGKIALGMTTGEVCDVATVLDVKTGALGWQAPMKVPQQLTNSIPLRGAVLQIVGDTVFVAQEEGIAGLDLATGAQKWAKPLTRAGKETQPCQTRDLLPKGPSMLLTGTCISVDDGLLLLDVDAATGSTKQEKFFPTPGKLPVGITLLSTSPTVVYCSVNDRGAYLTLDDQLNQSAAFEGGDPMKPPGLAGGDDQGFGVNVSATKHNGARAVIDNGILYTVSTVFPEASKPNELAAIDLKTGQRRWTVPGGDGTIVAPLAIDGDALVAVLAPLDRTQPERIIRVGLADGKVTTPVTQKVNSSPKDNHGPLMENYRFFWADGRVYAIAGHFGPYGLDLFTLG